MSNINWIEVSATVKIQVITEAEDDIDNGVTVFAKLPSGDMVVVDNFGDDLVAATKFAKKNAKKVPKAEWYGYGYEVTNFTR